jgi:hypothetical protein
LSTFGDGLAWNYRDLNGDGTKEILVWGEANPYYRTLVAFDVSGRELIREPDCAPEYGYGFDKTNGVCPIVGERIDFDDRPDGTVDITARDRWDKGLRRYHRPQGF